ncbi:MAG TPA: choice-of-anchor Q domain-containing protein [Anaerolineae bacterium]|nr:choice-of-anchor Q domain-containing protein [Anaerolineae bacterium]
MMNVRGIPVILALIAAGLMLIALTVTVSAGPAAPATVRPYPSAAAPCNTTLQACIDGSAPGDQINLAAGAYVTSVVIGKAVSLVGAGQATTFLQAPPGQRGLTISGAITSSTQIANLTIQGASLPAGNGGGVLVLAPAQPSLHDLIIRSNTVSATNASGGGLFTNSNLTLTNVQFLQNVAFDGFGGGLGAGSGAHLTLINVTFNDNGANYKGGGLFANSATITGSNFSFNVAGVQQGGGAYLTSTVAITNSIFAQNQAQDDGGGVFVGGAATVSGGMYQRNRSIVGSGGALFTGGGLLLSGSVITGSQSFDSGGGLFAGGQLTLTNALVIQNTSTGGSGAGVRAAGPATISGTQFISNTAFNPGGGLRTTLAVTLTNSTFISNTSGESGGGLRTDAAATISGGSFVANTADEGGGALVGGATVVTGTLFSRNLALFRGGGLDVITATVRGATFDQNRTLNGNGGGLFVSNILSLTSSLFTSNGVVTGSQASATGSGGGLFSDGVMTSTGNTFIGNFAHRLGGGADTDDLTSTGDRFRGNVTGPQGSGGGLFVSGVFDLDAGVFFTNTANTAGGLGVNSTASGSVVNSLFARNTVTFTDGGAAMRLLSGNSLTVTHNTIVGTSQPSRAAIHIQNNGGTISLFANILTQHAQGIKNFGNTTPTENYNLFFAIPTLLIGPFNSGGQSFTADPRFANLAADDYHLADGSPAIDATISFGVSTDFEGQPRPMGGDSDIGFDEALLRVFLPLILR